jgi:hypothetical protein
LFYISFLLSNRFINYVGGFVIPSGDDIFETLDAFRISPGALEELYNNGQLPRHRKGEWFVKFVPWSWIERLSETPGKTWLVGLMLWRIAGVKRKRTIVFNVHHQKYKLHPKTIHRALRRMEAIGLISVRRGKGKCPRVTLLDTLPIKER